MGHSLTEMMTQLSHQNSGLIKISNQLICRTKEKLNSMFLYMNVNTPSNLLLLSLSRAHAIYHWVLRIPRLQILQSTIYSEIHLKMKMRVKSSKRALKEIFHLLTYTIKRASPISSLARKRLDSTSSFSFCSRPSKSLKLNLIRVVILIRLTSGFKCFTYTFWIPTWRGISSQFSSFSRSPKARESWEY